MGRRRGARLRLTRLLLAGATTGRSSFSARSTRSRSSSGHSPEAELKVFERKLPLEWVGERTLRSLGTGTVVVAFSRKAVLALAGEVNRLHPGRVAVLYGAMPLASRRGDRPLPHGRGRRLRGDGRPRARRTSCETLLFAETTKFDGEARRDLLPWELAQIAGRAGRFGLVERGHVGVLAGLGWGVADPKLVQDALEPHVELPGGFRGYRVVDEARIRPRLSDLGVDDPADLGAALFAWHRVALREWAFESWLAVESLQPLHLRLAAVQRRLAERGRGLSSRTHGRSSARRSTRTGSSFLATLALALAGDRIARPHLNFLLDTTRLRGLRSRTRNRRGARPASSAGSRSSTPRRRRHDRPRGGAL